MALRDAAAATARGDASAALDSANFVARTTVEDAAHAAHAARQQISRVRMTLARGIGR